MMRKWRSGAGLIFSLGLIVAMIGGSVLVASATAGKVDNVTFCHASPPDQFIYQGNEPLTRDPASIVKPNAQDPEKGHDGHTADIIPAFDYETFENDPYDGHYPGKNLDKLSWIANGCAAPVPPKTNVNVSTIVFNATTDAAWAGTEQAPASAYDTSRVVPPSAIPVPTGTVTYSFYTNNTCAGDGSSAGTKTLAANGTVPISDTKSNLAAGSYAFRATYNGDSHYNSKTSDCEPFTVAKGPYDPSTTTTTVVFNNATNAALVGNLPVNGSVYDTSTVKHVAGGTPTGTIAYTFYTNNTCSGDGTSAGSGLALGTKSDTKGPLAAGQYSFKASYTSNTEDFNSSTSDCEPFTVSPAQLNPTPSPTGGVLAATGATPPTQDLAISLIALGLLAMMGGAFAWRRREA